MNVRTHVSKNFSWNSIDSSSNGPSLLKKFLRKAAETASSSIDFNLSFRKAEKQNIFNTESVSNLILQDKPTFHRNKSLLEMKRHTLEKDRYKSSIHRRSKLASIRRQRK
ncbi:unnamed protein product [Schistosoma turkestanicum]|nr:unnamed protein product [Schistosoma turkestanicum]